MSTKALDDKALTKLGIKQSEKEVDFRALPIYSGQHKLKSKPEQLYANRNSKHLYEPHTFELMVPAKYTPDFYIPSTNTYVEIKGRLDLDDLRKIVALRDSGKNIVVGLQKPNTRFYGSSKTTNEDRLIKENIPFFYVTKQGDQ